jgi:N-carbamoylputrescine amidase
MARLTVALLQMVSRGGDQAANLEKGDTFCRRAAAEGADIALFPEMSNIGYQPYDAAVPGADVAWMRQAIGENSGFVRHFARLARDLDMAIAVTYLASFPGKPQNAVTLFDRQGERKFTYSKVHTCCYEVPEVVCAPGADFHVASLDTRAGPVKVGAMICYDREFPESARLLMIKGAELILTPNACSLTEYDRIRIQQFRGRAFENMVAAAMANYPAPQHDGHSIACNPDGGVIVEADESEGIHMADFDLDWIRDWRATKFWGDAFRRPSVYAPLTDAGVAAPFIRTDLLGETLSERRAN